MAFIISSISISIGDFKYSWQELSSKSHLPAARNTVHYFVIVNAKTKSISSKSVNPFTTELQMESAVFVMSHSLGGKALTEEVKYIEVNRLFSWTVCIWGEGESSPQGSSMPWVILEIISRNLCTGKIGAQHVSFLSITSASKTRGSRNRNLLLLLLRFLFALPAIQLNRSTSVLQRDCYKRDWQLCEAVTAWHWTA